jgi:hypothetical protein
MGRPEGLAPLTRKRKDPADKAVKAVMSGEWRATPEETERRDVQRLLSGLADALNACEAAGHSVKLAHGAALTPVGYVLPVYPDAGQRFAVRTMALTEFPVTGPDEDEPCGI